MKKIWKSFKKKIGISKKKDNVDVISKKDFENNNTGDHIDTTKLRSEYAKKEIDRSPSLILPVITIPDIKNGKHLICDDSDLNRLVLAKFLERKGYTYDESINGLDAIEQISKNGEYCVVWMDIMMPRMDGMECTENLRTKYKYNGIIIGLTGYVDQETVNECHKKGMNHVISKPIDRNVLYHYAEKYTQVLSDTLPTTTTITASAITTSATTILSQ